MAEASAQADKTECPALVIRRLVHEITLEAASDSDKTKGRGGFPSVHAGECLILRSGCDEDV